MFSFEARDESDIARNKNFSRGAREKCALSKTRGATTVRRFPPLSTPTYVSGIIYMEMRICIDFTSKPVTEPRFGDRLSRYLASIKFSSLSKTRRRSEFPPPLRSSPHHSLAATGCLLPSPSKLLPRM